MPAGLKMLAGAATAALVFLLLFEVTFAPHFALPRDVREPDLVQEGRYDACFAARDEAIHAEAFGRIDNPDVQREFINAEREKAGRECRERYPRQWVTVRKPFRFNLVDVDFRYD